MTKLTFNGVNDDNQRAGIELDLSTGSGNTNNVPVIVSEITGKQGTVDRDIILFDNAPASVAISSGVVTILAANLVTLTYNASSAYDRYRIKMTATGTTAQEYAVVTVNAADNSDATNKLSHTMTPSDSLGGQMLMPEDFIEGISEDAIIRVDIAMVGTTPAADNGMIITVEVW